MISLLKQMEGLSCWHVSAGGVTAPTFTLVLGDRVRRSIPLRNPAQGTEFREFSGSVELLVWCSWRFETAETVLCSSAQGDFGMSKIRALIGASVTSVAWTAPAWDLVITFNDGRRLHTFSDQLAEETPIDTNWELLVGARRLYAGPGERLSEK